MIKKLYSFDFDNTLVYSHNPEEGKIIWKDKTGFEWPYNGWWSKSETLDTEIFDIEINEWVYSKYLEATSENNSYIIMMTGRLQKPKGMLSNIKKILSDNNLEFDEIHLNPGGLPTFEFKCRKFEELIDKTKCEELIMFDDREEHLLMFKEWAVGQKCKITIYDSINKTKSIIYND